MDYETVFKLIEEGEALLESNSVGSNSDVVRQLQAISNALIVASDRNGVIDQKCSSMMDFAAIAYASRKRQGYSREEAHHCALADFGGMRIHIRQLQNAGSRSSRRSK